jgi:glycosyltransferase involved in cell wall biosynthesis
MISIIVPTYNRAKTLPRAIDSILKQDYQDLELIIVDDGSTDNTQEILNSYRDSQIKVIVHSQNRGVTAAKNSGFDAISGDWFTLVDSDDELVVPNALSTAMQVLIDVDPSINAISHNCIDFKKGDWSGKGLDHDQFLPITLDRCSGAFRGITRTTLLGDLRFNEKICGYETILWSKIDQKAHRYYIHKALYIYHTEGQDRLTVAASKIEAGKNQKFYQSYIAIMDEEKEYLNYLKTVSLEKFSDLIYSAAIVFINANDRKRGRSLISMLFSIHDFRKTLVITFGYLFGPVLMNYLRSIGKN